MMATGAFTHTCRSQCTKTFSNNVHKNAQKSYKILLPGISFTVVFSSNDVFKQFSSSNPAVKCRHFLMFPHIDTLLTITLLSTTTVISTNKIQFPPPKKYLHVQWNVSLTKCQGTREIGLLYNLRVCSVSVENLYYNKFAEKQPKFSLYINMFLFNTVNNKEIKSTV